MNNTVALSGIWLFLATLSCSLLLLVYYSFASQERVLSFPMSSSSFPTVSRPPLPHLPSDATLCLYTIHTLMHSCAAIASIVTVTPAPSLCLKLLQNTELCLCLVYLQTLISFFHSNLIFFHYFPLWEMKEINPWILNVIAILCIHSWSRVFWNQLQVCALMSH